MGFQFQYLIFGIHIRFLVFVFQYWSKSIFEKQGGVATRGGDKQIVNDMFYMSFRFWLGCGGRGVVVRGEHKS